MRVIDVLLVEDSRADEIYVRHAFEHLPWSFTVARDGTRALEVVREQRFDLVLLDLNLPGIRGDEVLRAIKGDPLTASLPVVVLTSSADPDDIERSYAAQAAGYMQKPATPEAFRALARKAQGYWGDVVLLRGGLE